MVQLLGSVIWGSEERGKLVLCGKIKEVAVAGADLYESEWFGKMKESCGF